MINGMSHRQIESITCEGINFMYVSVDYGFILLSLIFRLRHAKQKQYTEDNTTECSFSRGTKQFQL
jgi:hypothetical protein